LQKNPEKCPYCGSTKLISPKDETPRILAEIEKLKKSGKYEEAALKCEELEMPDKAKEIRELNTGKVKTINMECPHCGAAQPLLAKSSEVACERCGRNYIVPQKVFELF
jgi:ribosomal protein S27AE